MADTGDKLKRDLNQAIKEGNELVRNTLRMLLASISNKEKEKQYKEDEELTEQEVITIISSEAKKRKESIKEFERGNRKDLAQKEKSELEILQKYLPEQLSNEEIEKLVKSAIEETGATSVQDIGKVMSVLMPKVKGRADGSEVNRIVRESLS